MAVVTFFVTFISIVALMYGGYRISMYLYLQGSLSSTSSQSMREETATSVAVSPSFDMQDYRRHYIKVSFLLTLGLVLLGLACLVVALTLVLR